MFEGCSNRGKVKKDSVGNFFFFLCGEFVVCVLKAWFTICKAISVRCLCRLLLYFSDYVWVVVNYFDTSHVL